MPATPRRLATVLAAALLGLAALTSCASSPAESAAPTGGESASTGYPLTLTSPYGETVLEAKPVRVATVSHVDTDIALALGVVPVTSPRYGSTELDPWTAATAKALGADQLDTYDSTDGTNLEALAAVAPDVILATSGWTLDADYAKLAKIAPVVSYEGKDGLTSMTWRDRTTVAAQALGIPEAGTAAVAKVDAAFADAKAANPDFVGRSFTYAVLHPDQITYVSYEGSDNEFFTNLGFVLPPEAAEFTQNNNSVSQEMIDKLDADVLMLGFPFGDEGVMTQQTLEANQLFRKLTAVENGHYLVIDDKAASPLAYPTPLSQVWVLDYLLPGLQQAVAGS